MDRKYDVITLGEILLRLSTPINGRLAQGDTLMKHLGGAELNIASEIGQLGLKTAMISKIPNNLLAAGSCLLAGPEIGTVVDIKRDQGSLLFEFADTFDCKFLCVAAKT